uniref:Uncharacterized protein n=1 Tax=Branchiostoma floridae TaxID=7739 RepID=C3ZAS3_BRAFL|eukprot:XP_002594465.1 hypothetical protein BRAFLDRAFT_72131 [Branchiostoma floridae]
MVRTVSVNKKAGVIKLQQKQYERKMVGKAVGTFSAQSGERRPNYGKVRIRTPPCALPYYSGSSRQFPAQGIPPTPRYSAQHFVISRCAKQRPPTELTVLHIIVTV